MKPIKFQNVIILPAILVTALMVSQEKLSQAAGAGASEINPARSVILSLDKQAEGALPPGWKIDATNPQGLLAKWAVVREGQTPSAPMVLSLSEVHDGSRGVFNLCWNPAMAFRDGHLEVKIRSNTGKIDQGGGLIWRARDANNYYVARYNPLEANFRLYIVKDGQRQMLADKSGLNIKTGEWFTLKILHQGDKIQGWLNDEKLLDKKDRTFPAAGGIGFWTKADAASSFKDLRVDY
jgi:hypothetical protein